LTKLIEKGKHFYLKKNEVVSGPFGSTLKSECYQNSGVPFVRIENIRGGFKIDTQNIMYISEENNTLIKNSELLLDDIVLSKVGNTIGFYARIDDGISRCNISENNIGIKLGDYPEALKHFILVYLNCYYGQFLTLRRRSGNAQPKLNVFDINELPIPFFSSVFTSFISRLVLSAESNSTACKQAYQQAERVLLEELGLVGFKPSTQGVSIKTFAQSFGTTGRLDAEYYQPKYDEMVQHLYTAPHNRLGELVNIQKSIEPGSEHYADEGMPFLRVSDLNKSGITEPNKKLSVAFCKENATLIQKLQPKKDTILFSKDGTVGIAHKLAEDKDCITSGAVLHLTVKNTAEILPDYLTLVLNSSVVQLQAERDAGGSIIQHWRVSEIEEVVIPVFSIEKQQAIAGLVQESFRLKTQSEALLEVAKRGVELAIETTEAQAQSWMQAQLEALTP
jgi:type I restriction enzyme S subunit